MSSLNPSSSALKKSRKDQNHDVDQVKSRKRARFLSDSDNSSSEVDTEDVSPDSNIICSAGDQMTVLNCMQHILKKEFACIIPRYEDFMQSFEIGHAEGDICLAIKLTILDAMDSEAEWAMLDQEYSIGSIKFSLLLAIWRTLIISSWKKASLHPSVRAKLEKLLNHAIESIKRDANVRDSIRRRFDS